MKCRLCGNDSLRLYYTQGNNHEFRFFKCNVCNLINYGLSTGLDQRKYATEYVNPHDDSIKMNIAQTQTYEFMKSHLHMNGRVFDIGCGNGRLLYLLEKDGWAVRGLELSPFSAQSIKATLNIEVEQADFLEYVDKDEDRYDVVVLRHVLEHLPDAVLALNKVNSLLKIDSHAVLEFPNIAGLDLTLKRLLQRCRIYRKKYRSDYKPGHCNDYSKQSFEYLASRTGFEVVVWETYSHRSIANMIYKRITIGNKARTIIKKTRDI
jgi:SAM-dependent methyltransferase